jgi:hypothetical protein
MTLWSPIPPLHDTRKSTSLPQIPPSRPSGQKRRAPRFRRENANRFRNHVQIPCFEFLDRALRARSSDSSVTIVQRTYSMVRGTKTTRYGTKRYAAIIPRSKLTRLCGAPCLLIGRMAPPRKSPAAPGGTRRGRGRANRGYALRFDMLAASRSSWPLRSASSICGLASSAM